MNPQHQNKHDNLSTLLHKCGPSTFFREPWILVSQTEASCVVQLSIGYAMVVGLIANAKIVLFSLHSILHSMPYTRLHDMAALLAWTRRSLRPHALRCIQRSPQQELLHKGFPQQLLAWQSNGACTLVLCKMAIGGFSIHKGLARWSRLHNDSHSVSPTGGIRLCSQGVISLFQRNLVHWCLVTHGHCLLRLHK